MSERQMLLRKISEQQFAATEIALFLDTHPDNQQALSLHEQYTNEYLALKKAYEEKFGPLTAFCPNRGEKWCWVKDPWPWEKEMNQ